MQYEPVEDEITLAIPRPSRELKNSIRCILHALERPLHTRGTCQKELYIDDIKARADRTGASSEHKRRRGLTEPLFLNYRCEAKQGQGLCKDFLLEPATLPPTHLWRAHMVLCCFLHSRADGIPHEESTGLEVQSGERESNMSL
ncbi:hypothetical protein WJX77_000697 [Trebouxia sp. C0004]